MRLESHESIKREKGIGSNALQPTMSVFIWKNLTLAVAFITLISGLSAQTATDRVGPIISALRNSEFDKALDLLQPALQGSPKNPQLWVFRGLAYSGKGDHKAALASYQSALKIAPDYLPALEGAPNWNTTPIMPRPFRCCSACCGYVPTISPVMPCWPCWLRRSETVPQLCSSSQRAYGFCLLELKQTFCAKCGAPAGTGKLKEIVASGLANVYYLSGTFAPESRTL